MITGTRRLFQRHYSITVVHSDDDDVSNEEIRDTALVKSVCVAFLPTESERLAICETWATVPTALNVLSPRLIML